MPPKKQSTKAAAAGKFGKPGKQVGKPARKPVGKQDAGGGNNKKPLPESRLKTTSTKEAIMQLLAKAQAAAQEQEDTDPDGLDQQQSPPEQREPPKDFSRICVKNIPTHLTEKRLLDHFAKKGQVTDAKILLSKTGRSRRMAFVGYKTPEAAAEALRYFHNTYIDTSKISVEPAFAKGHTELPRPWSKYSKGSSLHAGLNPEEYAALQAAAAQEPDSPEDSVGQLINVRNLRRLGLSEEKIQQLLTDPEFAEFIQVAGHRDRQSWANDSAGTALGFGSGAAGSDSEEEDERLYQAPPAAAKDPSKMSDLDFLRAKQSAAFSDSDEDLSESDDDFAEAEQKKDVEVTTTGGSLKRKGRQASSAMVATDSEDEEEEARQPPTKKLKVADAQQPEQQEQEPPKSFERIWIGNLPYSTTNDELSDFLSRFGDIQEVHVPVDKATYASKGFAFVTFMHSAAAVEALESLLSPEGCIFQGRPLVAKVAEVKPVSSGLLGVDPVTGKPRLGREVNLDELPDDARDALSYKTKKHIKERQAAETSRERWNALFVNADTVTEAIARRLGVKKSDILDRESNSSLAVRLALAETEVITETKQYLLAEGVNVEAFLGEDGKKNLSSSVLLVKNLPFAASNDDVRGLFGKFGQIKKLLVPPSRALAILEFEQADDAKKSFKRLAYTQFKGRPLYLQWAPRQCWLPPEEMEKLRQQQQQKLQSQQPQKSEAVLQSRAQQQQAQAATGRESSAAAAAPRAAALAASSPAAAASAADSQQPSTLYVKNLNFDTREPALRTFFENCGPVRQVRIVLRPGGAGAKKSPDGRLSMGYGFVDFERPEHAQKALAALQGCLLEGHALDLKLSRNAAVLPQSSEVAAPAPNASRANAEAPSKDGLSRTKITVKNLPFECTKQELRQLFSAYGHVKRTRVPLKPNGGHRGYGFVSFVSRQEAQNAFETLQNTHLYGRHLILQWAREDEGPVISED